jgi:radical SAM protein with 4Fe4S-binding SPASM domain
MVSKSLVTHVSLPKSRLLDKMASKQALVSFDLEVTARCNFACRHCYINLPAGDVLAQKMELSLQDIKEIADEAVSLGALWCLITGGEPLLREDFFDIYSYLREKGLLVSVFTNGSLITAHLVKLFKKYPPRDVEVTVYGITRETYEKVTGKAGAYSAFDRGLSLLLENGVAVQLKAMALRSNLHEQEEIARFCRERTRDSFRFDPFLHLRYDGNPKKNMAIKSERLSPEEIVALERADPERRQAIARHCAKLHSQKRYSSAYNRLFTCGAGTESCSISYDGIFRLCSSLWHPDCTYDLKNGTLSFAWRDLVSRTRAMCSDRMDFLEKCHICPIIDLCMWCPAHAFLETGELDRPVAYFCEVAHARAAEFKQMGTVN